MDDKQFNELTKENNFFELYKLTRKIPTSKDNLYIYWSVLVFFVLISITTVTEYTNELEILKAATKDLINWSISILGFVLAGYSIFASLTDKSLQLLLAGKVHKDTNINRLKHTHGLFIKVLIDLIILIFVCYFLKILFVDRNIIDSIVSKTLTPEQLALWLSIINAIVDSLFVYMLLLCKSFVYNVYHIIMITTRWEYEKKIMAAKQNNDK
tara:strand:+ start:2568 stop:3203 length:636 start_codon:yes stop_codon:yes gene_type:complete